LSLCIADLRTDGGTQCRERIDDQLVLDYCQAYKDGAELPPVSVCYDDENYWLFDGFHRLSGAAMAGLEVIDAEIFAGTQRDAILRSTGANAKHGKRRTPAERRIALVRLLSDPEWAAWPLRKQADQCGCSTTLVATVRTELRRASAPAATPAAGGLSKKTGGAPPPAVINNRATKPDPADDHDPIAEVAAENSRLEAQVRALSAADSAKELLTQVALTQQAQREQGDAAQRATQALQREAQTMRQLQRCGKAVGESDPSKIAPAVEAFVRTHRPAA
jgi:hypothetical protein